MTRLLVRNKVQDFKIWKAEFDAETERSGESGLELEHLWQNVQDANEVFFVLKVESIDRANEYMASPESAEVGKRSGVIDGECWFVE